LIYHYIITSEQLAHDFALWMRVVGDGKKCLYLRRSVSDTKETDLDTRANATDCGLCGFALPRRAMMVADRVWT